MAASAEAATLAYQRKATTLLSLGFKDLVAIQKAFEAQKTTDVDPSAAQAIARGDTLKEDVRAESVAFKTLITSLSSDKKLEGAASSLSSDVQLLASATADAVLQAILSSGASRIQEVDYLVKSVRAAGKSALDEARRVDGDKGAQAAEAERKRLEAERIKQEEERRKKEEADRKKKAADDAKLQQQREARAAATRKSATDVLQAAVDAEAALAVAEGEAASASTPATLAKIDAAKKLAADRKQDFSDLETTAKMAATEANIAWVPIPVPGPSGALTKQLTAAGFSFAGGVWKFTKASGGAIGALFSGLTGFLPWGGSSPSPPQPPPAGNLATVMDQASVPPGVLSDDGQADAYFNSLQAFIDEAHRQAVSTA